MGLFTHATKAQHERLESLVEELATDLRNTRMTVKKIRADLSRLFLRHAETRQHLTEVEMFLNGPPAVAPPDEVVGDDDADDEPVALDREVARLQVGRR